MQVWGCGFLAKSHYINLQDERQIGEDCPPSNISRTLCVLLSSGRGKNLHWKSFWTSCLWCWHPIATSSLVTTARTPLAWRDATAASLQAHSHPATSAGNWSPAVVPRQGRPSLARPRLDLTSVQFLWPGTIPTASNSIPAAMMPSGVRRKVQHWGGFPRFPNARSLHIIPKPLTSLQLPVWISVHDWMAGDLRPLPFKTFE